MFIATGFAAMIALSRASEASSSACTRRRSEMSTVAVRSAGRPPWSIRVAENSAVMRRPPTARSASNPFTAPSRASPASRRSRSAGSAQLSRMVSGISSGPSPSCSRAIALMNSGRPVPISLISIPTGTLSAMVRNRASLSASAFSAARRSLRSRR